MDSFRKKLREQLIVTSDEDASAWSGIERSTSDIKVFEPAKFHPIDLGARGEWSGEVPRVTLVIEHSEKVASLTAHEEVPEEMMYYLLDCFQQAGLGNVRATRTEVRKINAWLKHKMMDMEANGMIWREEGKWIFEG